MATVAGLWCVFWIILDVALALPAVFAVISLCLAMVIFAIGETMLSPVGPAIVNEIAPEHLRGRYNAAPGLTWGVSGSVAPAIIASTSTIIWATGGRSAPASPLFVADC